MLLEHTLYFKTLQEARDAEKALAQTNIDYSNVQVSDRAGGPLLSFQTACELSLAVQVLLEDAAQSDSADFNVDAVEMFAWEMVFGAIPVAPGTQGLVFQHQDLWERVRQEGGWMTEEQELELNRLFSGIYPHLAGDNIVSGKPVWEKIADCVHLDEDQTIALLIFEDDTAAIQLRYVDDALIPLDFDQAVRLGCALLAHTGSVGNEVQDLRCPRLERLSTETRTRVARNGRCVSCGVRRRASYGLWCMECKRASLKSQSLEEETDLCDMSSEHGRKALLYLACLGLATLFLVAVCAVAVLPGLLPGMLTGLLLWWSEGREKRADRSSYL